MENSYSKYQENQEEKFSNFSKKELEILEWGVTSVSNKAVTDSQIEICNNLLNLITEKKHK